jgi:formate hydrogenlyase subunit 4
MEAYVVRRGGAPIEQEMIATSSLAEKETTRTRTSTAKAGR